MNANQDQAKDIFLHAAEIAVAAERQAFIADQCGGDAALHEEVDQLLLHLEQLGPFLKTGGTTLTVAAPDLISERPGTVIGPYKLLEQIGEGGFGVVFMAEQLKPVRRKVALKVIKPGMDTRQIIARFEAERQALALMDHPNIAKVLDAGATESARPYFVMELVKGLPITEYCNQKRLTARERLELFIPVCQAVQHAHQKGIIHRDLKPSNVLVTEHDGTPVVKVIDFGIAKATGQQLTDKTLFTNFAQMIGTPLYMSPEQAALSNLDIDTRSDIYALGVLLYELLTGTTPFDKARFREAGYDEIRRIIREEEPPKPSTRISTLGQADDTVSAERKSDPKRLSQICRGELDWIVMKALEKDRTRRYETASAFAADVQRHLNDEAVEACPPSALYKFTKFARRNKRGLVTGGLVGTVLLAAIVAVAGTIGWQARDRAVRQAVVKVEVQRSFKEVQRLQDRAMWSQALEIARQTQTFLDSSGSSDVFRQQVRERVNDLSMILRLAEIRLNIRALTGGTIREIQVVDTEYVKAFQEYAVDIDALRPDEAAAIIQTKSVRLELAQALDIWARVRRGDKNKDRDWRRLNAVARAADPDEWRNRFRQAWESSDEKGLETLIDSAKVDELLPETIALWADALRDAGRVEQAIAYLQAAQRRHCGNFWINQNLAWMLANNVLPPRYDEAIRYFWASSAIRPDYPITRVDLGDALSDRGEQDEAITWYRDAIRLKPNYAAAYCNMGLALYRQGKKADAEAAYRKAIEVNPEHAKTYSNLGAILCEQGKFGEAEAAVRKSIDLDAFDAQAYCNLGTVLNEQLKFSEADAAFRKAIALKPNDAEVYITIGIALAKQQRFPEAIAAARKAVDLDPFGIDTRYDSACIAARAGCAQMKDATEERALERARLRAQGLTWLRGALSMTQRKLAKDPDKLRAGIEKTIRDWQQDPDFNGVRDADALAKLPEAERREWSKLWEDVEELRKRAGGK